MSFHEPPLPCSYIILKETINATDYYYAINGDTGETEFGGLGNMGGVDGTSASAVIQSALDALDSIVGGKVLLKSGIATGVTDIITIEDKCNVHLEGETPAYHKNIGKLSISESTPFIGRLHIKSTNDKVQQITIKNIQTVRIELSVASTVYRLANVIFEGVGTGRYIKMTAPQNPTSLLDFIVFEHCFLTTRQGLGAGESQFMFEGAVGQVFFLGCVIDHSVDNFTIFNLKPRARLHFSSLDAIISSSAASVTKFFNFEDPGANIEGTFTSFLGNLHIENSNGSDLTFLTLNPLSSGTYYKLQILLNLESSGRLTLMNNLASESHFHAATMSSSKIHISTNRPDVYSDGITAFNPRFRGFLTHSGFVTENSGTAIIASGESIDSGLALAPIYVSLTPKGTIPYQVSWENVGTSSTIRVYHNAPGSIEINWYAEA